jgi:HAD superfamily hydrolase (TIGR01484 family)
MKKYKALMLDLDGTTIPPLLKGLPSRKVSEAIAKANKRLHVGIVSARPFSLVKPISSHLSLSGPSIISGGAQIVDFPSEKIVLQEFISKKDVVSVANLLEKLKFNFIVQYDGLDHGVKFDRKNVKRALDIAIPEIPVNKAIFLRNELKKISSVVSHVTTSWNGGGAWVQISSVKATKQHAILAVARILGIETHEIIGVGDGYNDFPLLMACGLKVAMGNAVPELKEIADYIAPSVEEDGVADVIEKFVLQD